MLPVPAVGLAAVPGAAALEAPRVAHDVEGIAVLVGDAGVDVGDGGPLAGGTAAQAAGVVHPEVVAQLMAHDARLERTVDPGLAHAVGTVADVRQTSPGARGGAGEDVDDVVIGREVLAGGPGGLPGRGGPRRLVTRRAVLGDRVPPEHIAGRGGPTDEGQRAVGALLVVGVRGVRAGEDPGQGVGRREGPSLVVGEVDENHRGLAGSGRCCEPRRDRRFGQGGDRRHLDSGLALGARHPHCRSGLRRSRGVHPVQPEILAVGLEDQAVLRALVDEVVLMQDSDRPGADDSLPFGSAAYLCGFGRLRQHGAGQQAHGNDDGCDQRQARREPPALP